MLVLRQEGTSICFVAVQLCEFAGDAQAMGQRLTIVKCDSKHWDVCRLWNSMEWPFLSSFCFKLFLNVYVSNAWLTACIFQISLPNMNKMKSCEIPKSSSTENGFLHCDGTHLGEGLWWLVWNNRWLWLRNSCKQCVSMARKRNCSTTDIMVADHRFFLPINLHWWFSLCYRYVDKSRLCNWPKNYNSPAMPASILIGIIIHPSSKPSTNSNFM